jgi:AraC-like DNA-binding protein
MSNHSRLDLIRNWENRAKRSNYKVFALAKLCRVNARHLQRYFQMTIQQSPHNWMLQLRLRKGRHRIARGGLVKEGAAAANYSKAGNFSRDFKRIYHMTPTEIRKPSAQNPLGLTAFNGTRSLRRNSAGDLSETDRKGFESASVTPIRNGGSGSERSRNGLRA